MLAPVRIKTYYGLITEEGDLMITTVYTNDAERTRSCFDLTSDDLREIFRYFGLYFSTSMDKDDLCYRLAVHMNDAGHMR